MTTKDENSPEQLHRQFAVELFNLVWNLMDKEERTQEENERMLHAAHASRFHWGEIGTPLEFERGEWQVSRVYSLLKRSQPAIYHATRCLDICTANNIGDFDIAFAYEAMARAHAVAGDSEKSREYIKLGEQAGEQIKDKDDRDYLLGELNAVSDMLNNL